MRQEAEDAAAPTEKAELWNTWYAQAVAQSVIASSVDQTVGLSKP